ncbi:MAG: hypothetical protein KHX48_07015 [Alistipes sp.]|nr:hypothetical protein [Alistipes sp.]
MKKLSVFVLLLCSSIVQMLSAQDLPREKCYFPDSMYRRQLMTRSGDQLLEQIHHPSASELAAQSADMNSLIRNISASTDQYGRTTVQIPLYEMTTNSGALPIAIQYSTGGIKVDEIASVAGLGWNLMAGGRITRPFRDSRTISTSWRKRKISRTGTETIWMPL